MHRSKGCNSTLNPIMVQMMEQVNGHHGYREHCKHWIPVVAQLRITEVYTNFRCQAMDTWLH